MPRRGLNQEVIVREAAALIEECGYQGFSMSALARRLGVKTASLYGHVENMEKLLEKVSVYAASMLIEAERRAAAGRSGDGALFALAEEYRAFVAEHYRLYCFIMGFVRCGGGAAEADMEIVKPIMNVIASYGLDDETEQIHWQRVLRAVMAGFAVHEHAGGFSGYSVAASESYKTAIECIAGELRRRGGGRR